MHVVLDVRFCPIIVSYPMLPEKFPVKSTVFTLETITRSIPGATYVQTRYAAINIGVKPIAYIGRTGIYSPTAAPSIRARVRTLLVRKGARQGRELELPMSKLSRPNPNTPLDVEWDYGKRLLRVSAGGILGVVAVIAIAVATIAVAGIVFLFWLRK